MSENEERIEIQRGLKGVYFDRSKVCFIDGRAGELRYRGYSIHDLAAHSTFEETCYLLLRGELPTRLQLDVFSAELKSARTLPEPVLDVIRIVKDAHPMDVLRTAVSTLSAFDPETADKSTEATLRKGLRLTAQVPMIVTAHERIRHGQTPVAPDPSLGHAANFLYMLTGKTPSADTARLMDVDMVLHAEHGSNASSFAARVVAGTEADLHGAITAAVAALAGPAHGGAAEIDDQRAEYRRIKADVGAEKEQNADGQIDREMTIGVHGMGQPVEETDGVDEAAEPSQAETVFERNVPQGQQQGD